MLASGAKGKFGQAQLVEIGHVPKEWRPGELLEHASRFCFKLRAFIHSFILSFLHHMKEFRKTSMSPQDRLYNTVKYFQPLWSSNNL